MASSQNYYVVESASHFQTLLSADLERVSLLNFWAPWAEPCKKMNDVVEELAKKYESLLVLQIEADAMPDIAESFDINAVPSFVLLRGHDLLTRISGADAPALTAAAATYAHKAPQSLSKTDQAPAAPPATVPSAAPTPAPAPVKEETKEELNERMTGLMKQSKVVLFMKGSPGAERCGFSRQTVALLKEQGVEFSSFDILQDSAVRSGMKELNNWPTFPQIIVNGELIGGLDVLKEMVENGEFAEALST